MSTRLHTDLSLVGDGSQRKPVAGGGGGGEGVGMATRRLLGMGTQRLLLLIFSYTLKETGNYKKKQSKKLFICFVLLNTLD